MKNILLRADANIDIGIGHAMRCIALGQMLRKNGYKIHFLTKTNSNNILKRIINENFILELIEYHEDLEGDAIKTKNYAKGNNITWVITDGYIFNTFYQEIIKDSNLKLCCIDDIAVYHYVSDIIINQNLNAEKIFNYSCEKYTKLLLGINYVMLRKEFSKIEKEKLSTKNRGVKNLLITLGGSDSNNYSLKILHALKRIKNDFKVKLVLGTAYPYYEVLKKFIYENNIQVEVLSAVNNMVPLYKWADITITAGGSTVWELLKMNKHILTVVSAENQEKIANELQNEKLTNNIGKIDKFNEVELSKNIEDYLSHSQIDKKKLEEFSKIIGNKMPSNLINLLEE